MSHPAPSKPPNISAASLSFVISFFPHSSSPRLLLSSGFPYFPYLCLMCSWRRGLPGMGGGVAANVFSKQ